MVLTQVAARFWADYRADLEIKLFKNQNQNINYI